MKNRVKTCEDANEVSGKVRDAHTAQGRSGKWRWRKGGGQAMPRRCVPCTPIGLDQSQLPRR